MKDRRTLRRSLVPAATSRLVYFSCRFRAVPILAMVSAVTGCTSNLYTVKKDDGTVKKDDDTAKKDDELAGIPFFQIHQGLATTQVRAQRWWELKATVEYEAVPDLSDLEAARVKAEATHSGPQREKEIEKISDAEKKVEEEFRKKNPQKLTQTVAVYYTDLREATDLLLRFNREETVKAAWDAVKEKFFSRDVQHSPPAAPADVLENVRKTELVSIERKKIQIVDKKPYYLNVAAPWFGTANATVTLAHNGTLTSAQAQRDPQVAALVTAAGTVAAAGLTPLATFMAAKVAAESALEAAKVTAAANVAAAAASAAISSTPNKANWLTDLQPHLHKGPPPPHILRVEIKPTEYTRRFSCTTETDTTAPVTVTPSTAWCDTNAEGVSYKIEVIQSDEKKEGDDGDKAISVTGKIKLPKPDPGGK